MATFTKSVDDKYEFELLGKKNSARKYIAIGLSLDESMVYIKESFLRSKL